jgi:hypothetical protein
LRAAKEAWRQAGEDKSAWENERQNAAMMIQRLERGRQGRRRFGAIQEDAAMQEEVARKRTESAMKEMGAVRAARAKQSRLREREEQGRHQAACKIQSLERGRQARRHVGEIRLAHEEAEVKRREKQETRSRERRERREERRREQAAIKIQSLQRGRVARKDVGKRRSQQSASAQRASEKRAFKASAQRGLSSRRSLSSPPPLTASQSPSSLASSSPESDVPLEIYAKFRGIEQAIPLVRRPCF